MATLDDYKQGSYRGIPFFYRSSSQSRGFKVAEHLYPGSDNFKVEQLGKRPRRFDMELSLRFEDKETFENALNTSGTGILVHPAYGNFLVKVTEYTTNDSINEIGLFTYSVQFVVELGLVVPTAQGVTTAIISQLRSTLISKASAFAKSRLSGLGF